MSSVFTPGRPVELITDRFLLKTLDEDDVSQAYVDWLNDPEVNAYLEVRFMKQTADDVLTYVRGHNNRNTFLFGIFAEEGTRHIGNFSLVVNSSHKVRVLGVMVGDKDYWGAKVVLEARAAILDFCFDHLDLCKVHGGCYSDNLPAIYNYRHQGWSLDGIRKNQVLSKGKYVDVVHFAMFRSDYQK